MRNWKVCEIIQSVAAKTFFDLTKQAQHSFRPLATAKTNRMSDSIELHAIHPENHGDKRTTSMDVVFIHGLDGDHDKTWRASDTMFWPQWVADDHPHAQVWSLGYPAKIGHLLQLGESHQLNAEELAHALADRMRNKSPSIGSRPCIFVCHSLGGLLAKRILINAVSSTDIDRFRHENVAAVMFLGTPHRGSGVSNALQTAEKVKGVALKNLLPLFGVDLSSISDNLMTTTKLISDLEQNNVPLQHLNEEFQLYYAGRNRQDVLRIRVFAENQKMKVGSFRTAIVVDKDSANPNLRLDAGQDAIAVTLVPHADHSSLVKPTAHDDAVCEGLNKLIELVRGESVPRRVISSAAEYEPRPGATNRPSQTIHRNFESHDHLSETDFHKKQSERLRKLNTIHPFKGAWAEKLATELQVRFPVQVSLPCDHLTVFDCFANAPKEQAEGLMTAMRKACTDFGRMDEADTVWATELTVYAAIRLMNRDSLSVLPHWTGGNNEHAAVISIPTSSSLIASIALAALRGTYIRLGSQQQSRGSFQAGGLATPMIWSSTTATDSILGKLYDELMRSRAGVTRNPNSPLTTDQKGELLAEFDEFREDGELATIFIETLPLNEKDCEKTAKALAETVNAYVIRGSAEHVDSLVNGARSINVASLKAKVEKIFGMLPHFADSSRNTNARSKPSGSSAAAAQGTAAHATPAPYTWDVFMSHASEDKEEFVDALVAGLGDAGLAVWYDKKQITAGDSLPSKVSEGLRKSRLIVAAVSLNFLAKGWPKRELDAGMSDELTNGAKRVVAVLLNIRFERLAEHSLLLSEKLAIYADKGIPHVVAEIKRAVDVAKLP